MSYISDEVQEVALSLSINITRLTEDEGYNLRSRLAKAYTSDPDEPLMLSYQNLKKYNSFHGAEAWKLVGEYVKGSPILFFNPCDDLIMFQLNDGESLAQLLSETSGFPFYVTSDSSNYLICYDDHDCLICTGDAYNWCESLIEHD